MEDNFEQMTPEQISKMVDKALKKIAERQAKKDGRLLKDLTPNEIWNEFSRSNIHLPKYNE